MKAKWKKTVLPFLLVMGLFLSIGMSAMAGENPYKGRTEPYQCTYVCWDLVKNDTGYELPWFPGNAVDWYNGAINAGLEVSQTVRAKSVAVYKDTIGGGAGHVAYIKEINNNGIFIQEGNYGGKYRERTVSSVPTTVTWDNGARQQKLVGFIYIPINKTADPGTQTIKDGKYFILSKMDDDLNVCVQSVSTKAGANVHLWRDNLNKANTWDVKWQGNGYYKLINTNSGKALDVSGGSFDAGANVQQWDEHNDDPEQWVIRANDDWSYSLIAKNGGYTLDAQDGKTDNGTNLRMWYDNGSNAQKFYFVEYSGQTIKDGTYYISPKANNSAILSVQDQSKEEGKNVELFSKTNRKNQTWEVKHVGKGIYSIINTYSGMSLDVSGGNRGRGTNVKQWHYHGDKPQQWVIKANSDGSYGIISRCGGRYLDMASGKTEDGTNVQMWNRNDANAQKWTFTEYIPPVKVTLDPNGGYWRSDNSTTAKTLSVEAGKSTSLSSAGTPVSNEHKVFAGWSDKKNDTSGNYKTSITANNDTTLYAQWKDVDADNAIIILDGNGGYYNSSGSTLVLGGKTELTLTEFKKGEVLPTSATGEGGYFGEDVWKSVFKSFAGWYKDKDLTEVFYPKTDVVPGDMILYAKWEWQTSPLTPISDETTTQRDEPTTEQEESSTKEDDSSSTTKKDDSSSTTKKDDSSSTTKKDDSSSTTKKDDSSSTTKKDDSSSTTKKDDSSSTTKKDDSSSTTKKDDSSTTTKKNDNTTVLNGIVKGPDGKWAMYKNNKVDTSYTGIAKNNYGWWRVKKGYVDFNANGIYKNQYGWWKTTDGKVTFKETGVFKNEYGWWRVEDSKVNFKANGIYKNQYGWWKTTNGKVSFKENGVFKNDYGWWKVKDSKVDFNFTGIAKNKYGSWYVKNGKVDFNKNGKVTFNGTTYTVKNGKVQ